MMASNVNEQLLVRVKNSDFFAIQLDESTDVINYTQLMVYVRYIFQTKVEEDYLFCEALSIRTTADEIFKKLSDFFTETELDSKKCVDFCFDLCHDREIRRCFQQSKIGCRKLYFHPLQHPQRGISSKANAESI